ncbi:MAG TPA: ABC transporter substrate-binding protein, partial [Streptosporangiaceae bacterium]|nr:ABC transporter substrate-binding protein [Streptosporangiaceae bacterium]
MRSFRALDAPRRPRRRAVARRPGALTAAALAAAASLALSACSPSAGGSAAAAGRSAGGTLTVGFSVQAPATLDPAKAPQNYAWFEQLAYEPLIVQRSDGSLAPGLAQSWSYAGTGNTTFVMHLRPGVKFSDGSPLTAA